MSNDSLGDRMKSYEHCYRLFVPKKSFIAVRLDGKSFHSYTKGLPRPFDKALMDDMDETTKYLCENVACCKVGYVQSDEITLILTEGQEPGSEPWFGNNLQKICSITASMATAKFNQLRMKRHYAEPAVYVDSIDDAWDEVEKVKLAHFDSRVFVLPTATEVKNCLTWRSNDATRNSIQMVGQSLYSHKELHGVSCDKLQELIFQKGINWNGYSYREKRGGTFTRQIDDTGRSKWKASETPLNWFDGSLDNTSFGDIK